MNDWHTIDEEHHVASTIGRKRMLGREFRLTHYLVHALSSTNLSGIEDGEVNLFAAVIGVCRVITTNNNLTTVDKLVDLVWVTKTVHLGHDLLHLTIGKRIVTETIDVAVVVEDNSRPVLNEVFLCWIHNYMRFPTMLRKEFRKGFFKIKFLGKRTEINIYWHIFKIL